MIAQLSLCRCTPLNALSIRSPAVLALHRSISLNSGIQQGLLAERRGRRVGRTGGSRATEPRYPGSTSDLPERGARRPREDFDRSRHSTRREAGFARSERSDRPTFESRGRTKPGFGSSRSARPDRPSFDSSRSERPDRTSFATRSDKPDRPSLGSSRSERTARSRFDSARSGRTDRSSLDSYRSERPNRPQFGSERPERFGRSERPSFDSEGRSSRAGYATSKLEREDPRFQSGKKPGKWERAAVSAGAGRSDWRDVRAANRPGTGPTKRYSKPNEIWNKYRSREEDEAVEEASVLDSFGDIIRPASGRRDSQEAGTRSGKRLNRRAEKKEDRRPSHAVINDLESLEIENAVPELGDNDVAPRNPRREVASERRISEGTLPDKVKRQPDGEEPYVHVHFDKKPSDGPRRTREEKKLFNKSLKERSGRSGDKPLKYAQQEYEELEAVDEAMEVIEEADELAGKPSYASRRETQFSRQDLPRERRGVNVETEDMGVPSRIRLTSATSELIFGRNSVMSVLRSKRRKLYKLYVHERLFPDTKGGDELYWELGRLATDAGVEVAEVGDEWLPLFEKTSLGKPHNGCILEASPVPTPSLSSLGETGTDEAGAFFTVQVDRSDSPSALRTKASAAKVRSNNAHGNHPLVVFCHNLTDTGNFGALLRSAYWFKVDGVAFPIRASAKPDAFTVKTSAGASEGVNLFSIRDPTAFLKESRKAGWEIIAAMPPSSKTHFGNLRANSEFTIPSADSSLAELRRRGPVLLMLGGEEHGIPFSLAQIATGRVSISGDGKNELGVDSLNVSVACSLILSEFARPLAARETSHAGIIPEIQSVDTQAFEPSAAADNALAKNVEEATSVSAEVEAEAAEDVEEKPQQAAAA